MAARFLSAIKDCNMQGHMEQHTNSKTKPGAGEHAISLTSGNVGDVGCTSYTSSVQCTSDSDAAGKTEKQHLVSM